MLERIINSRTRLEMLSLFFSNEDKMFRAGDIVSGARLDPANVHKELGRLVGGGFLNVIKRDGRSYYKLNKDCVYYGGLKSLFRNYAEEGASAKWFILEEILNAPPAATNTYVIDDVGGGFLKTELGLKNLCQTLWIFEKGTAKLCHVRKEFRAMAREVFEKLIADPRWGLRLNETVKRKADAFAEVSRKIYRTNLRTLTDRQLLGLYLESYERQRASHVTGWPSNVVDFEVGLFSKHLLDTLNRRKTELGLKHSVGEDFSVMTTPAAESYAQKEYRGLIEILAEIRKDRKAVELFKTSDEKNISDALKESFIRLYRLIDRHRLSYGWLAYMFEGPGWDNDYFIGILASLVRQDAEPPVLLRSIERKNAEAAELKKRHVEAFRLSGEERDLFRVAEGFVFMKGYRKDQMFLGMCCQEFLFREIARRTDLSLKQVRYMYPWEFEDALLRKKVDPDGLNARHDFHVFYGATGVRKVLAGEQARKFLSRLDFVKEEIGEVSQLNGETASPGKARGTVSVINSPADLEKMKRGGILVSLATSPDLMPAIKLAAAIVTDMGGVTCHAAIISREIGVPCVIGTKIATKALKDGDVVEVDASHGRVTVIERRGS